MGTVTITLVETGQTTLTKTITIPDADIDRCTAALQQPANIAINGTATRSQVWNVWISSVIASLVSTVKAFEIQNATQTAAAAVQQITTT